MSVEKLEGALTALLTEHYRVDHAGDFESQDGRRLIEVRLALFGVRDLDAAIMQLGRLATKRRDVDATLIAFLPRMARVRIEEEWRHAVELFRPGLSRRLGLVATGSDGEFFTPDDPERRRLMTWAAEALRRAPIGPNIKRDVWSPKAFDVWCILLDAWLRCEGPLAIGEVVARSGASHPTVRATLSRLQQRGELLRGTNRRAELSAMPLRSLNELIVLADGFRHTARFVDRSGRTDTRGLLRRITAQATTGIAIGGVEAARRHVRNFDLNGLPRVDVTVDGSQAVDWVAKVDPALAEIASSDVSPVLVVHQALRADPRFDKIGVGARHVGPAETLLDLYDLRLTAQAEDFVRTLRGKDPGRA